MKKKLFVVLALCSLVFIPATVVGFPSVYPTGTTIYKPDKCWNGFTIYPSAGHQGAILIDMNGNVVRHWKEILGEPVPNKILPGGYVMGSTGARGAGHQEFVDLVQVDWNGNIVWKFNKTELIKDPGKEPTWMARQHHDWQREGNPVGYYVPGMDPLVDRGKTLILAHKNVKRPKMTDKLLEDDRIIEVSWDGKILWEWLASDHFDEMGFSEGAKNTLYRFPGYRKSRGSGDWMHVNSMSYLGPNKWYDAGDERFHPDNIIIDGRSTNTMLIIEKKTGKIVWRVGPDYTATPALRKLGQIIGQHHCHMIPRGLPGAGNILVFDNGGWAGYDVPNPGSPYGTNAAKRDHSRVLEFNPITLKVVWQYTARTAGFMPRLDDYKFYSGYISGAQRLPNGNTLITEGADGRIIEVTPDHKIVWEYISPYYAGKNKNWNLVYRAYRVPYDWVPQLKRPVEKAVIPPDNSKLRVQQLVSP
ncbi:MAG: aryl-sulfate sulfotransferase [Deltaproteobacteria bacterium]|nr:aryl-sulfate sulfotransferase [Deltaproteobacteria bacterium]MBW2137538.1 aryl-sulfate sulfotransferase [Deltaproteobacteria bacterium]